MKRFLKVVIFLIVLVSLSGLSGAFYYFHFKMKPDIIRGFIAKAAPPPTSVAVSRAEMASWVPGLTAIGSARAFQGIDVASQLAGVVAAIHIGSGQDVARGAPLFDLDTSVERADLKSNLAALTNTDVALKRQQMLMTGGNTAKANLDAALAARDQADAAVERVKATIAQKTLVAPFMGRLGIRKLDVGQFASAGTSLITLQQLDPIFVDFPIPEQSLGMLKSGQAVDVKVDAYPGTTFHGKIDLIDARIAAESRSVMVRALFANPDHRLLPGMFANVAVNAGSPYDVVVVPRTAVGFSLYGDSVFVVTPKPGAEAETQAGSAQAAPSASKLFIATRRFVRTGDAKDGKVAILDGLTAGDLVVSEGQIKLQSGATVVIDADARLVPPAVRPKE
jgi:RND family efflux transporter MFP subunit